MGGEEEELLQPLDSSSVPLPQPRMKGMLPPSRYMIRIHTIATSKPWASQGTVEGNLRRVLDYLKGR